jgi:H+/Cl- antiporter ClcA
MQQNQPSVRHSVEKKIRFWIHIYPSFFSMLQWTALSIFLGLLIGSASAGFLQSLNWTTDFRETHLWVIVFLPICGFGIGLLYHYFGKEVVSGNNLLIDTIHKPEKTIPFIMTPLIYLGTIATHFFGGSAGREGTALQMAGAIADQFSKPFKLSKSDRKILLIAAVAGGFGSVFGTPLAGAIFALEFFLIGKINYKAIFPALLTSIFADIVTKLWGTPHTDYQIDIVPTITFSTVLYAILGGIVFGICAAIFSKLSHQTSNLFKTTISYPPFRPLIGGIIVALAIWMIGTTKYIGLGIPTIVDSFENQLPIYDFAIKMAFTIITLSAGFKGGEVTPLFFIGATLGSGLSLFIPLPTALLAGMGFVAVFSGATNTPIACTFMAIELFGIENGVYFAISCVVSYLLSGHQSIYNSQKIGEPKHVFFSKEKGKRLHEM